MTGEQRFEPEPPSAESVKTHQGFVKIFMSQTLSPGRAHQQPSGVWGSPHRVPLPLLFYATEYRAGTQAMEGHQGQNVATFKILKIQLLQLK